MALVEIHPRDGLILSLAYATSDNFVGKQLYENAYCFLEEAAVPCLEKALVFAKAQRYGFMIFDAFRPSEVQWKLWEHTPDPQYVADPRKGSSHTRGVAVDLTLYDLATGEPLDMGTPFDDLTTLSHHGNKEVSPAAQLNRFIFLGIMASAGWDYYRNEWWHYQLFDAKSFPLLSDAAAPRSLLKAA